MHHSLVVETGVAQLSEAMSHTMHGHQGRTGYSGEFWQNTVHWRREWQTTPVFLPGEPNEQYEKAKRYDTGKWVPRLESVPHAVGEEWRAITNSTLVVAWGI